MSAKTEHLDRPRLRAGVNGNCITVGWRETELDAELSPVTRESIDYATPGRGPYRKSAPAWVGAALGLGTLIVVGAAALAAIFWPVAP